MPPFTTNVHVKKIVLSRNQLSGKIPDLSMNTKLEYLFLQNNQLTGPLPTSLSTLSHMEWLGFGDNQLTGEMPSLAKLERLKVKGSNVIFFVCLRFFIVCYFVATYFLLC